MLVLSFDDDVQKLACVARREAMTSGWAWLVTDKKAGGKELAGWLWFRPSFASDMRTFAEQVSKYTESHFNTSLSKASVDVTYSAALYDARVGPNGTFWSQGHMPNINQ